VTSGARGLFGVGLLAVGLVSAARVLEAGDARYPETRQSQRLLYVRSGTTARRLALSFQGLAADVYWMRTIQHFGGDLRSNRVDGRFELLAPLLDLTTSLDPHFNIAYRFGALFLAIPSPSGAGRPDEAVALLEKGLRASPDHWQYAYDIGFVYYLYVGDFKTAGTWFTRAAAMSHAPDWIRPLAAATVAQGGDRANARRLFSDLAASDQPYLRNDAARGLAQIDALDAIDQLQAMVETYHAAAGHYPTGWADLIRTRQLPSLPVDGARVPFVYDASSHHVLLGPGSPLAPLPTALGR
jgi:tetratricopeptide (TPR) repeat protein